MKDRNDITQEIRQELLDLAPDLHALTEDQVGAVPDFYFENLEEQVLSLSAVEQASHTGKLPENYFKSLEKEVMSQIVENRRFVLFRSAYFRAAALILVTFCGALLIRSGMSATSQTSGEHTVNLTAFVDNLETDEIAALLDDFDSKEDIGLLEQASLLQLEINGEEDETDYFNIDASDATLQEYFDQHIELF